MSQRFYLVPVLWVLFATFIAAQQPAPPPTDAEALLKEVQANQKILEERRKDYIFHRHDEEQDADEDGHVKKTQTSDYEVYFVGNWQIERLLLQNGNPLSDSAKKKQDESVAKQEKQAREHIRKSDAGENDKEVITISKFLAADRFYNLRRDTLNGHEVYAFDFEPRPDFKPHSLSDRILTCLGGTLWVDEEGKQAVRLEAHLLQGMKLLGGLVGSVKSGANVVFEEQKINNEVWMPAYGEVHLDYRLFFKRNVQNIKLRYSDYRKFKVDSKITGYSEMKGDVGKN